MRFKSLCCENKIFGAHQASHKSPPKGNSVKIQHHPTIPKIQLMVYIRYHRCLLFRQGPVGCSNLFWGVEGVLNQNLTLKCLCLFLVHVTTKGKWHGHLHLSKYFNTKKKIIVQFQQKGERKGMVRRTKGTIVGLQPWTLYRHAGM